MTGAGFCVNASKIMRTLIAAFSSSVGKKFLMAFTGLLLSLFLIAHAIGNSTTFLGLDVFNAYAEHLHSLGFFITLFEIGLLLIFGTHIAFAIILYFQNLYARTTRYLVQKASGGRTPGSRTMPYTGLIILIFIIVHLGDFHFIEKTTTIGDLVKQTLNQPAAALFYIVAMAAVILHISHGFWSLFQTFGVNHPKYDCTLRSGTLGLTIILGTVFVLIPLLALVWSGFLS